MNALDRDRLDILHAQLAGEPAWDDCSTCEGDNWDWSEGSSRVSPDDTRSCPTCDGTGLQPPPTLIPDSTEVHMIALELVMCGLTPPLAEEE